MSREDREQNPVKIKRLEYNLTQLDLARHAGCTRGVVTDTEAGLYNKPPASLVAVLSRSQEEADDLYYEWERWVRNTRRGNRDKFNTNMLGAKSFEELACNVGGSIRGFAQILVFDRSMIQQYLKKGWNWYSMADAMSEVGLSNGAINIIGRLPWNKLLAAQLSDEQIEYFSVKQAG